MLPRPTFRMPVWAALAIVGAAYLVRSLVIRSGDFALDLPGDLIVFGVVIIAVFLVARSRREMANGSEDEPPNEERDEDDGATDERE